MKTFTKINDNTKAALLATTFLSVVMMFNYAAWF